MKPVEPFFVTHLIPDLDQKLIELLKSLTPADWNKQTLAPQWKVKDVVTHMLDITCRGISSGRDQHSVPPDVAIHSYQDLIEYLNQLNGDWAKVTQRLSPQVLIQLLQATLPDYAAYLATLDPFAKAIYSVAWAGESESQNWFHLAREYSEKWHHQQQIRQAVGQETELLKPEWYLLFLDVSMRALPHHYRNIQAPVGSLIQFSVTDMPGSWYLQKTETGWQLFAESSQHPTCQVTLDKAISWKIFTKAATASESRQYITIQGDRSLGEGILTLIAVIA